MTKINLSLLHIIRSKIYKYIDNEKNQPTYDGSAYEPGYQL